MHGKKNLKGIEKVKIWLYKKKLNGIEECSACSWQYVTVLVQQLQLQPLSMLVSEASFTNKKKRRLRLFFWQNDSFEMSFTAENTNRWLEKCNNLSFKCYIILSAITFSPVNSIYRLSFCQKIIAAVYFFFFLLVKLASYQTANSQDSRPLQSIRYYWTLQQPILLRR